MSEENKREYLIPFKGCWPINKRRANVVDFTLICGFLAAAVAMPTLGKTILSDSFVLGVTVVSFILGKKFFG